jgi:hypothetical protein
MSINKALKQVMMYEEIGGGKKKNPEPMDTKPVRMPEPRRPGTRTPTGGNVPPPPPPSPTNGGAQVTPPQGLAEKQSGTLDAVVRGVREVGKFFDTGPGFRKPSGPGIDRNHPPVRPPSLFPPRPKPPVNKPTPADGIWTGGNTPDQQISETPENLPESMKAFWKQRIKNQLNNQKRTFYMHRYLLNQFNYDGKISVDHINQDKTDNRLSNLRLATQSTQTHNRTLLKRNFIKENL